jgi:sterol desaturase/sphingolipid hydroxylase (fatty acid hydroxylase superfamily)
MLEKYIQIVQNAYSGYWNYLLHEVLQPSWHNYFYWLLFLSLFCWALEAIVPWRKKQSLFRQDFWLDGFYMFFNYFLFSLIIYNAVSDVFVHLFKDFLSLFGISNLVAIQIDSWSVWAQLLLMFVLNDFIQWNIHRLLHHTPRLWEFHKVHHSVKEMGFAAHLRFHWMESVIYKSLSYLPLSMIGFGLSDFFIIHIVATAIGHLNHSNLGWDYGIFRYLFNNPKMHIWHHAKHLPDGSQGVNFGLSLSIWDYLFGTAHLPHNGRDIELGFEHDEQFPKTFWQHFTYFGKKQS